MKSTNVLLAAIVGILLVLLIIVLIKPQDLTLSTTSPTPTIETSMEPSPMDTEVSPTKKVDDAMMADEEDGQIMTVSLATDPNSNLKQSGTATLTEQNGKVKVVLTLNTVSELSKPQPAHIHTGSCPTVGAVVYPLTDVVNGKSETVVNTTMANLKSQLPLAINVHKSGDEASVYTACGSLK